MKKTKALAVQLSHVTKKYVLRHEKPTLVEQLFKRPRHEQFTALKNVSLNIHAGEKVGIIGDNGSGKTTLLKIIANITVPTSGTIRSQGKIVSLIDLESGFHPDLTGEENIYLNGLVIGMSKPEIKAAFDNIVKFADIKEFMDAPLYTYSAGMKLRLGLAVAVHSNPDILILDEAIMVGDQNFQEKTSQKIEEFFRAGKTILVVTHWMEFLKKHAQRVVWLENGKVKADGSLRVINSYLAASAKNR